MLSYGDCVEEGGLYYITDTTETESRFTSIPVIDRLDKVET